MIEWGNNWARGLTYRRSQNEAFAGYFSQIGRLYNVHHIWCKFNFIQAITARKGDVGVYRSEKLKLEYCALQATKTFRLVVRHVRARGATLAGTSAWPTQCHSSARCTAVSSNPHSSPPRSKPLHFANCLRRPHLQSSRNNCLYLKIFF